MAVSLTTLLPPTRSGRTLFISSSLLGSFALLQMALLCWHLWRSSGQRAAPEAPQIRFAETTEPSTSGMDVPFQRSVQPASEAKSSAALTSPPAEAAPRPTPASPALDRPVPASPVEQSPAADLIEMARRLRQNGDVTTALARLREAQVADPSNPQVIAELGVTYEAMQLTDRAFEQWQRLYSMGDSIGALYYLADEKLHGTPAAPAAPGSALTGQAAQQPLDNANAAPGPGGFQDNAMLKITDVNSESEDDPAVGRKVALKIVVKNRPGSAIDPNKVQIETYFYDLVDGKDIVQTNAQTDHQWLTTPVTWANDQSEVLETTYFRPKDLATPSASTPATSPDDGAKGLRHGRKAKGQPAEAAAPATPAPGPVRVYLGYTVRLYYNRDLQDVKADPLRLLQQFPPPLTLPEE